jgi:hypothetical protein
MITILPAVQPTSAAGDWYQRRWQAKPTPLLEAGIALPARLAGVDQPQPKVRFCRAACRHKPGAAHKRSLWVISLAVCCLSSDRSATRVQRPGAAIDRTRTEQGGPSPKPFGAVSRGLATPYPTAGFQAPIHTDCQTGRFPIATNAAQLVDALSQRASFLARRDYAPSANRPGS